MISTRSMVSAERVGTTGGFSSDRCCGLLSWPKEAAGCEGVGPFIGLALLLFGVTGPVFFSAGLLNRSCQHVYNQTCKYGMTLMMPLTRQESRRWTCDLS